MVYLAQGKLPWQGLKAENKKQRYEMICETKMTTKGATLCGGMPHEYVLLMDYIKKLPFDTRPNYEMLRGMFREAMHRQGIVDDGKFDWMDLKSPQPEPEKEEGEGEEGLLDWLAGDDQEEAENA